MTDKDDVKQEYEPLCRFPQPTTPEEYRMGEHKPPLFLIVLFCLVFLWAMVSWVPFFGY